MKENSHALSLLSLVRLSILSQDIFPQICYLSQVGNIIPPKSACPSFSFHFVLGTVRVLRQILTKICIPLARNKPGLYHLPTHDCWSCFFSSLPATLEFILRLCSSCLCLKCILIPPLSLSHCSPTCLAAAIPDTSPLGFQRGC